MAIAERTTRDRLAPIVEEVAKAVNRHNVQRGDGRGAKGLLRIQLEEDVRRIVQAYWTPFEVSVPGRSVGLHLEVAEPRVHWSECYLSREFRNWMFCFGERDDGDIQLLYYREFDDIADAVDGFFKISSWYVLTATDTTYADVQYTVSDALPWSEHYATALASTSMDPAVQEALKKSTIIWLRWDDDGRQRTMPVWFVFDNKKSKIYVLSGERQQTIPGADSLRRCTVIFRWKGKNARIGEVPASVRVLEHGPEWDEVAEKVAEKRLNIPGLPEETAKRWRDECVLLELTLEA